MIHTCDYHLRADLLCGEPATHSVLFSPDEVLGEPHTDWYWNEHYRAVVAHIQRIGIEASL